MNPTGEKLSEFVLDGKLRPVIYVETQNVKDGVNCDIYRFVDDDTKDLAIVTVQQGAQTPLQRILKGTTTIEGFVSGKGRLRVQDAAGASIDYRFPNGESNRAVTVQVGKLMQWAADQNTNLVFSEVCTPPYEDGRFENLPE